MNMSNDKSEDLSLVDKVEEPIFTDSVVELKSGIYNLFISMYNSLILEVGVEEAIRQSTQFLDEISYNFKQILIDQKESNKK